MLKRTLFLMAIMAVAVCQSANAGTLRFSGTTSIASGGPALFGGKDWSLNLTYTPGAGAVATVTAATLLIDVYTFSLKTSGSGDAADTITVAQISGSNNDEMTIVADFQASVPGSYGSVIADLTGFKVQGTADISGTVASDPNLQLLGSIGNLVTAGAFRIYPHGGASGVAETVTLTGSVPAPEPGSFALLAGLGVVVARRFMKARKSKA